MPIDDWLKGYTEDFGFAELADKLGEEVVYIAVGDQATSRTINAVFNEFVGAIDEKARMLISISADPVLGVETPRRGDTFTLNGKRWYVIDFRTDEAGLHELRCDLSQEDI